MATLAQGTLDDRKYSRVSALDPTYFQSLVHWDKECKGLLKSVALMNLPMLGRKTLQAAASHNHAEAAMPSQENAVALRSATRTKFWNFSYSLSTIRPILQQNEASV